jgi:hypothetical protein
LEFDANRFWLYPRYAAVAPKPVKWNMQIKSAGNARRICYLKIGSEIGEISYDAINAEEIPVKMIFPVFRERVRDSFLRSSIPAFLI